MSNANLLLNDLNAKNRVKELLKQKDEIKVSIGNMFNGEEKANEILSKLNEIEIEDIKHLTDEKVDELLTVNGELMSIPEDYKDENEYLFKKDLLLYLLQADAMTKDIEKAEEELNKAIEENEKEVNDLLAQHEGSMISAIRAEIVNKGELATTDSLKKTHSEILNAFDDSFELTRIFDIYSTLNTGNTIRDFEVNFNKVYRQYASVNKRLNITFDLIKFGGLEKKFLDEKYHKHANLFIFIVMKYMAKRNGNLSRHTDGVFCSQLCTNLYLLFTETLEEEYKTQLISNITKILDLFM